MKKTLTSAVIALALTAFNSNAFAEIQSQTINYTSGDTTMKGYIAYDDAITEKRPAVLVVHEWWGHNDFARQRAEMLAKAGYTAMAVDMYGDGKKADHPMDAKAFSSAVKQNMDTAEARFNAAINALKQHKTVDPETLSAIGYCFGGGIVLEMIRRGVDLDVAASFHGSLATSNPALEESLKGVDVLVFNGAADKMVKHEQVLAFMTEMTDAKASLTLVNYPDTLHAFTNPQADEFAERFKIPLKYNQAADEDSWSKLINALDQRYKE